VLSKKQANIIADALLDEARAARPRIYRPAGTPVHWLYRCRALRSVPDALQPEVVRQAKKEIATNPWFLAAMLVWVMALAALWMTRPAFLVKAGLSAQVVTLSWLVPLLLQRVFVRRAIKTIATRLGTSAATDA
jgi:hypothetical protein